MKQPPNTNVRWYLLGSILMGSAAIAVPLPVTNTTDGTSFGTIEEALADPDLDPGDAIHLANGLYTPPGTLYVNTPVTITGESEGGVTIDLSGNGASWGIAVQADNVSLSGFTILPPIVPGSEGTSGGGGFPIHAAFDSGTNTEYTNLALSEITIANSNRTAFDIHGFDGVTLTDLTATGSQYGNGIQFTGCENVTMTGCSVSGNAWGGVAVYVSGAGNLNRASSNIAIDFGANSLAAPPFKPAVYVQNPPGLPVSTGISVTGGKHRIDVATGFIGYYDSDLADVAAVAAGINVSVPTDLTTIFDIVADEYNVVPGLSIQSAINSADPGDTIRAFPGSYVGPLNVDKALSLVGPNEGVSAVSGPRGSEAVIDGLITIASSGVTLDGLSLTNPTGTSAIYSNNNGDLTVENNLISGVNIGGPASAHGIYVKASAASVSNFSIIGNSISAIGSPAAGVSTKGIYFGDSNGPSVISNITIGGNAIDGVVVGPKGAYGILINHGVYSTGSVSGVSITNNTVSNLTGKWVHGIGLETETAGAIVTGNEISTLTSNVGSPDAVGVLFEGNPLGATAVVSNNIFRNSMGAGVAIHPNDVTTFGYVVDASENYWDAADGPSNLAGATAIGSGTPVGVNVTFSPWYAEEALLNLVSESNFSDSTIPDGSTEDIPGNLFIGAGSTITVEGSLIIGGELILAEGASLVVIDGDLEMGDGTVISGTFTIFNSFGSWNINGDTTFNVGTTLSLVTDVHIADGSTLTVNGGGELIFDGCVIDSQNAGFSYTIEVEADGLLTMARCDVTDAVIDIDSTSPGSKVYDSYFTDSSIEASNDSAVYHNVLNNTPINTDGTGAFDSVDAWANVSSIGALQNLFTLDLDISALTNRTVDADQTVYVQPLDALLAEINVSALQTEISAVEVLLGYSTGFYDSSAVAFESPWNVDLASDEDDTGVVGKLDSAIGLNLSLGDPEGSDAPGTIGKVTLQGQGAEGETQFFHRVKLASDTFVGETRFTTGGSSPTYLSPFTVNSPMIVLDGTEPVIDVNSLNGVQVQASVGSVDVLDPEPASAPAFTFRNGNTVEVTFTATDAGGSGFDLDDLANDFEIAAVNGGTTLDTYTVSAAEAGGVVTYTALLEIPTTAPSGIYALNGMVTDRSGNGSGNGAPIVLGYLALADEIHADVELEGFVGGLREVTFTATDAGGANLGSWTKTVSFTGALGSVSLENVPAGTVNLSAKTDWNLRSKVAVSFNGTGVGTADLTVGDKLPGGDLNGDNLVNTLDYSILRFYWASTTDSTADIDGSGTVFTDDYNLLRANFYTAGDAE